MKMYQVSNSAHCRSIRVKHQDELKTNEIRRTLAVFLIAGTSISNEEALQATEGYSLAIFLKYSS
jgi:hypothetical protein